MGLRRRVGFMYRRMREGMPVAVGRAWDLVVRWYFGFGVEEKVAGLGVWTIENQRGLY